MTPSIELRRQRLKVRLAAHEVFDLQCVALQVFEVDSAKARLDALPAGDPSRVAALARLDRAQAELADCYAIARNNSRMRAYYAQQIDDAGDSEVFLGVIDEMIPIGYREIADEVADEYTERAGE